MTLNKDQDPGWWSRGMTKRAQIIVAVGAGVVFVVAIVLIITNGIPLL